MAKPKGLERLRRYGVSERERQQIRVYCRKNPGNRCSLYEGQQEEGNETLITALIKAERVIRGRRVARVKQTTITSFFK
jgi:hypothetical protein